MSEKAVTVPRPRKKAEYEIRFATRQAEKGWKDLLPTTVTRSSIPGTS